MRCRESTETAAAMAAGFAPALAGALLLAGCGDSGGAAAGETDPPDPAPDNGASEQADEDVPDEPELTTDPPPRFALDGVGGINVLSTAYYEGYEDRPVALRTSYIFPERTYHSMAPPQRTPDRMPSLRQEYRYGSRGFKMEQLDKSSEEYADAYLWNFLRRIDLRQAVFLWPHGFDWKGEGKERRAELRLKSSPEPHGFLVAELGEPDEKGRVLPRRIEARNVEDRLQEAFEIEGWFEARGRTWPKELWLSMRQKGEEIPVWREEVGDVDTRVHFIEEFFLPPDRRDVRHDRLRSDRVPLPAATVRRVELGLPEGASWGDVLARARELLADALDQRDDVEGSSNLVLSDAARPTHVELRLREVVEPPPAGWVQRPAGDALSIVLPALSRLDRRVLSDLREQVPQGAEGPERVFLRPIGDGDDPEIQVVLAY